VREGVWRGPTVLLCPAHQRVNERGWKTAHAGLAGVPDERAAQVLVVHGTNDETVPLEHSRRLVTGARARLLTVTDDHRLSASATSENLAAWIHMVTPRGSATLRDHA
jgi:fermentation-respiration switch protein FrsA (DUF1100 family)